MENARKLLEFIKAQTRTQESKNVTYKQDKNQNPIYSLELESLESKLSTKTHENKHSTLDSRGKDFDTSVDSNMSLTTSNKIIPQTPQQIIKQGKEQGKSVAQTKQTTQQELEREIAALKGIDSNFTYTTQETKDIRDLRNDLKETLKPILNKEIINKETGLKGVITETERNKISSKKAVDKSVANGFTIDEHYKVGQDLKNLYENATKRESHNDYKNRDNIIQVHRFTKDINVNGKEAIAKITLFEKKQGNNKIYTLELENLENPTSLGSPHIQTEVAVQAQVTRDGVRPNASIAKTDTDIIPQESEFIQRLDKISPRLADETRANALNKDLKEAKARFNLKNTDKENAKLFNKVIVVAQQLGVKFESKGKSLLGELGHYNPSTNTAKVFTKGEKEAETILHELIHSVTTRALHTNSKHLTPLQNEAVKEIKTIFQTLSKDKAFKETYALSSVDEMLAELSNKAFRILLKGKNLLQRMYNAIAKLIFKRQNNYDKLENALYKLMDNYGDNGNSRINGKILNSMGLEKDFLKNDKVDLNALKKEAVQLPKALNETEFKAQFKAIKGTKADVKTPIGNVSVDINAAWKHLIENTYLTDRREFSGAFFRYSY